MFVNPRSGDGKAARAGLAERARGAGIEAVILAPGQDLAALARDAVTGGADALGMAGGDGSLAVVAAAAAGHEIPFVCVPAGTRNHFALDVGVDRRDRGEPGARRAWRPVLPNQSTPELTARRWNSARRCSSLSGRRRCGSGSPRATRAPRHQRASRLPVHSPQFQGEERDR